MIQDIELQDLPTIATNDIPEDSLIPIALRESNLTPFELYKITLRQLQIKLTTIKIEDIYNSFEKDPELTNILFQLENDLIILNYDETKLNDLINDVQNFIVPSLNAVIFALTDQQTGDLYNLYQELTTINAILDFLQQQALNSLKTLIVSVPTRLDENLPYSLNTNYQALNNDYNFYLDGFYNIVYLNIYINTQIDLDREVEINIFNVLKQFELLVLSPEKNLMQFKIQFRLNPALKANLQFLISKRIISFYRDETTINPNDLVYRISTINSDSSKGNAFSFSVWFNQDGLIANDADDKRELLSSNDLGLIINNTSKAFKFVLESNNLVFFSDGAFFSAKIDTTSDIINISVLSPDLNIENRLFIFDVSFQKIPEVFVSFAITIGAFTATVNVLNPNSRSLLLISGQLNVLSNFFLLRSLILFDDIEISFPTTSIQNENTVVENDVQNLVIYQNPSIILDNRTIVLNITGDKLENVEIILNLENAERYYMAYSFQVNSQPVQTIPLIWVGNPNTARIQINKIKISYNVARNDVSTEILDSQTLSAEMVNFANTEIRLLTDQLFGINFYAPLGILSNRSSLNNPFGSFGYTVSNISRLIPRRDNEYRFRGGLYAKSFDSPITSSQVVITQEIHLVDWNIIAGIGSIPKNPDEKTFYIFVDNLDRKYFCDLQFRFDRDYGSSFDIAFLLGIPSAIINDPIPNFATTYGYQIAGKVEIFRKTIPANSPPSLKVQFILDYVGGVATELPYVSPIVQRFDSAQYWTIPEVQAYVAQEIAIIISGGTIDLSGYVTVANFNNTVATLVPLNLYNIDQNIIDNRLDDLENRVDVVEADITTINGEIVTINNDIIDINQSIDDINLELNVIDASIIDLQNQIDLKASILYVNNINAQNQVQIVPYQII